MCDEEWWDDEEGEDEVDTRPPMPERHSRFGAALRKPFVQTAILDVLDEAEQPLTSFEVWQRMTAPKLKHVQRGDVRRALSRLHARGLVGREDAPVEVYNNRLCTGGENYVKAYLYFRLEQGNE